MCTQNWRKYKQLLTSRQFTLLGGSISAQETTARSLLATSIPSVVYQRNRASDNPGAGSEEVGSETSVIPQQRCGQSLVESSQEGPEARIKELPLYLGDASLGW